jgi:glycosyltransferase involved in cell wall biosynthesis
MKVFGSAAEKFHVSVMVIAYKMEKTIIEAIDGALSQTVPCEIIVSDDASPGQDRSYELALAHLQNYSGPHRVMVRRNEKNVGLCEHINILVPLSSGEIIVFMAGDDVSYPHRVERSLAALNLHADSVLVGSHVDEIDGAGQPGEKFTRGMGYDQADQHRLLHCGSFICLLGASMALRRSLLADLPPLVGMVEDNMISLRGALFGPIYCIRETWLQYRRHEDNLSAWVFSREGDRVQAKRQRYERTIRMYREIADDHERCVNALPELSDTVRRNALSLVAMYRIEADGREAVLNKPKREWIKPIMQGLRHPGLRRKAFERAIKIFLPRRWAGIG